MAKEQKRAIVTAQNSIKMECETAHHDFVISGAPTMGGKGRGVDPAESLLAALGACALVIAKSFAPLKGIELTAISVEVTGDFENYGFEFLKQENKTEKIGYSHITSTYSVESPNSEEEIRDFIKFVEGNCPVRDTIENPPNFGTDIKLAARA